MDFAHRSISRKRRPRSLIVQAALATWPALLLVVTSSPAWAQAVVDLTAATPSLTDTVAATWECATAQAAQNPEPAQASGAQAPAPAAQEPASVPRPPAPVESPVLPPLSAGQDGFAIQSANG